MREQPVFPVLVNSFSLSDEHFLLPTVNIFLLSVRDVTQAFLPAKCVFLRNARQGSQGALIVFQSAASGFVFPVLGVGTPAGVAINVKKTQTFLFFQPRPRVIPRLSSVQDTRLAFVF